MTQLNDEMQNLLNGSMWIFATADSQGEPNAVPIHFKKILNGQKLLLVDNFMNKTKANLTINSRVAVTVWKEARGFQFKGTASYLDSGPLYEEGANLIPPGFFPEGNFPKGVVLVEVDAIYSVSPGPEAGSKLL